MARTEVTAGEWLEFVNFNHSLGDPFGVAFQSGLELAWGGSRYVLAPGPNAANRPMSRITWRQAAMYCNWLHNDKGADVSSMVTGAYDTSTWGSGPDGTYTDGGARLPGARFWIPSLDEWIKAVHYNPNKNGPGNEGYWIYPNSSDTAPVPGDSPLLGGIGETNSGWLDGLDLSYRVGMYPDTTTPWGLLDASGGKSEWLEGWLNPEIPSSRLWDGAPSGDNLLDPGDPGPGLDGVYLLNAARPTTGTHYLGLRLASAVPAPTSVTLLGLGYVVLAARRREQC